MESISASDCLFGTLENSHKNWTGLFFMAKLEFFFQESVKPVFLPYMS